MFQYDAELFYSAQKSLNDALENLDYLKKISESLIPAPNKFRYTGTISDVKSMIFKTVDEAKICYQEVLNAAERISSIDNLFAFNYNSLVLNFLSSKEQLSDDEKQLLSFSNAQYHEALFEILNENKDILTEEQKAVYEYLLSVENADPNLGIAETLEKNNQIMLYANIIDEAIKNNDSETYYNTIIELYEFDNSSISLEVYNQAVAIKEQASSFDMGISDFIKYQEELSTYLTKISEADASGDMDAYYQSIYDYFVFNEKYLTKEEKESFEDFKELKKSADKFGLGMNSYIVQYEKDMKKYNDAINERDAHWEIFNYKDEKKAEKTIRDIEKKYGMAHNSDAWEDITNAVVDTGAAWVKGFDSLLSGDGLADLGDAVLQTLSTAYVAQTSFNLGVLKLGEYCIDGLLYVSGGLCAGATYLFDKDLSQEFLDTAADMARYDIVGNYAEWMYECTPLSYVNEKSNLSYGRAGAKLLQDAGEFAGKVVIATVATVASGGTLAPVAIGAFIGGGKSFETYTQSVDRENGESYDHKKAAFKTAVGAASTAAEMYGYGQMGAGLISKMSGVPTAISGTTSSTSFLKNLGYNLIQVDNIIDTGAVLLDNVGSVITGEKTITEAIQSGLIDLGFALGFNLVGAAFDTYGARKVLNVGVDNKVNGIEPSFEKLSTTKEITIRSTLETRFPDYDLSVYSFEELKKMFPDEISEITRIQYKEIVLKSKQIWPDANGMAKVSAMRDYDAFHGDGAFNLLDPATKGNLIETAKIGLPVKGQSSFNELLEEYSDYVANKTIDILEGYKVAGKIKDGIDVDDVLRMIEDDIDPSVYLTPAAISEWKASWLDGNTAPKGMVNTYIFQGEQSGVLGVKTKDGIVRGSVGRPEGAFSMSEGTFKWITDPKNGIFDKNGNCINRAALTEITGGVDFGSGGIVVIKQTIPEDSLKMATGNLKGAFTGDWCPGGTTSGGIIEGISPHTDFANASSIQINDSALSFSSDVNVNGLIYNINTEIFVFGATGKVNVPRKTGQEIFNIIK